MLPICVCRPESEPVSARRSSAAWRALCPLLLLIAQGCSIDGRDVEPIIATEAGVDGVGGSDVGQGGRGPDGEAGQGGAAGTENPDPNPDFVDQEGDGLGCDACAEGTCEPGAAACATETARVECSADGVWSEPQECQGICSGEACSGECRPGTVECLSTTGFRECSPEGLWSEALDCPNACVGDACTGVCIPGARQCVSATRVQVCSDVGEWGEESDCENACSGNGCTGECVPTTTECFSATQVRTCSAQGQWQTPVGCPLACVGATCGGECAPGDRRCDPESGSPQTCEGGSWVTQAECPFVCVGRGTCGGECSPNDRRCNASTGVPQLCNPSGTFVNQPSCQFVCSGGFCGGECVPGSTRCDGATGVPQRCSTQGLWQNQAACAAGSSCAGGSCLCNTGLASCGGSCTSLATDANNCGSCGHSCLGGQCVAGSCQAAVLATGQTRPGSVVLTDTHLYWLDGDSSNNATLRRVPKAGGTVQNLVTGPGGMSGLAIAGNQVYFGTNDFRTSTGEKRVRRANLDGTGVTAFSPNRTEAINRLAISNNFVFYQIVIGINASNTVFRAPLLSQGQTGAAAEITFATIDGPLRAMTAANGCIYFIAQDFPAQLRRVCTAGAAAVVHYTGAGNLAIREHAATDATHIYFNDAARGMIRVPLAGGAHEVLGDVNDGVPTVDTAALFYFTQTGNLGAPACTTSHTLFRARKTVGSTDPVTLLPSPHECPTQVAVDATALYWSTTEGRREVLKVAK